MKNKTIILIFLLLPFGLQLAHGRNLCQEPETPNTLIWMLKQGVAGVLIDYSEQRTEALELFSEQYFDESKIELEKIMDDEASDDKKLEMSLQLYENIYERINQQFIDNYSKKIYSDQDKTSFRLNNKYEVRLKDIINQELKVKNDMLLSKMSTGHVKDDQMYELLSVSRKIYELVGREFSFNVDSLQSLTHDYSDTYLSETCQGILHYSNAQQMQIDFGINKDLKINLLLLSPDYKIDGKVYESDDLSKYLLERSH